MHLLAHYFLPLENPAGDWDKLRIFNMITTHDLDELETGDTIAYLKTPEMYAAEAEAGRVVVEKAPYILILKPMIAKAHGEYNERETIESKFVKAVDAFEPLIQIYSPFGKSIITKNKATPANNRKSKDPHIIHFPTMWTYYETIHLTMIEEGYFNHS